VKILLVEDDRSLSDVITRNLMARGHSVTTTNTAEGAVLELAKDLPETVILDVNLPDFSAWEVLRRMGPESRRRLRVIVMSAFPISQKRIEEFHPQSALQKPFPIGALMHAVENSRTQAVGADG
jgi:two-component system response regulator VicR